MFTESAFSKVTKGKRRSSGIEGFRNVIRSLLKGAGGDALLCNGLSPVCELNSRIHPTRLCQYLENLPNI